jgi:predicted nucleic acid-binding protein
MTEPAAELKIYLETNFFIRAVEGTHDAASSPRRLIELLKRRTGMAITSEITFAEVLAPPKRADALPLQIKRRAYLDLLLWSGFIELVPVSRSILMETADVRTVSRLKLPDAIHLVSAIQRRCGYFVSADKDFNRLPGGMVRLDPDHDGLSALFERLA